MVQFCPSVPEIFLMICKREANLLWFGAPGPLQPQPHPAIAKNPSPRRRLHKPCPPRWVQDLGRHIRMLWSTMGPQINKWHVPTGKPSEKPLWQLWVLQFYLSFYEFSRVPPGLSPAKLLSALVKSWRTSTRHQKTGATGLCELSPLSWNTILFPQWISLKLWCSVILFGN